MSIEKLENLKNKISDLGSLVVAFSGGVDSSFLAKISKDVLGNNAMAITIKTKYMSKNEIDEAIEFAKIHKINHQILEIKNVFGIENNPKNRCYLCKKELFSSLLKKSLDLGFKNVADGTNKDDLSQYRPGIKAANELGILSPLLNFSKDEIRQFSKILNLKTYDKPSYPCLLTRFPYEYKFSKSDINLVENVENLLIKNGYKDIRARFDGKDIKIEMNYDDIKKFINDENLKNIIKEIQKQNTQIFLNLKGVLA